MVPLQLSSSSNCGRSLPRKDSVASRHRNRDGAQAVRVAATTYPTGCASAMREREPWFAGAKNSWTVGKRGNSERADVTQENHGGRGWGIGAGLILGIILALLSILRLPFVGGRGLRSAAAAKRASEMVDDRLGEPLLSNSEERDARGLPQAIVDWPKPPVQAARRPKPNAEVAKTVPLEPSDPQRLPVEAPRPMSLPPLPSPAEDYVAGEEPETLLQHARFLIKAGLAPMAPEPLRKIVKEAPGTPIAREAQRTLDSISRN
jgi:hypothetical protein